MGKSRLGHRSNWWTETTNGVANWLGIVIVAVLVAASGVGIAALQNRPGPDASAVSYTPAPAFTATPTASPSPTAAAVPAFDRPGEDALVYLIGDSWSRGYSADAGRGYADLLADATGWDMTVNAESGTGYRAVLAETGTPYPDRVASLPEEAPALVIIQGGLNDEYGQNTGLNQTAQALYEAVRAKYAETQILVVGPASTTYPASTEITIVDRLLRQGAAAAGVAYISPLQEKWVNADNVDSFIDPETYHPGNEGHAEFARRLVADIDALP